MILRWVRAALLACPAGVVCGPTAAHLHGLPDIPDDPPVVAAGGVHLLLSRGATRAQRSGIVLHWTRARFEVVDLGGLPVTALARTLADCVLWLSRAAAVGLQDAALHAGCISPAFLPTLGEDLTGRHGGRDRVAWCLLADRRCESPLETYLRLLLMDAGLMPEASQYPVINGRRTVARVDFAWPSIKIVVEADGVAAHEAPPAALLRDRRRQNELVGLGWRVLRFTWGDVVHRPGYVIALVARHVTGPPAGG